MKRVEFEYGNTVQKAPSYMCDSEEFELETSVEDGSTLTVVDKSTHKVVGYYIAFDGYWNEV